MKKSPPTSNPEATHLVLICGDEEFTLKSRAQSLFDDWCKETDSMDREVIEGNASTVSEALQVLGRVSEALNTLPFFGGEKIVWLKNVSFLADDRTSISKTVTEAFAQFGDELKTFKWTGVRLLISAFRPDKRRTFYKTLTKIGSVEEFAAVSINDKDWADRLEVEALHMIRQRGFEIDDATLVELVARVGPNMRALHQEVEKLTLFALGRKRITQNDVVQVIARQKTAKAFALAEALGDRNLPLLMQTLDEELWEIRAGVDRKKSEIGLLYMIIQKVRTLLFIKEAHTTGLLKPTRSYGDFKEQLLALPPEWLAGDKRTNPMAGHPFTLFNALNQSVRYTSAELIRAMEVLLETNRRLVSSSLNAGMVLQQAMIEIVGAPVKPQANPRPSVR